MRKFDYSVLGKFHVIMADPPWDIHMKASVELAMSLDICYSLPITSSYLMAP